MMQSPQINLDLYFSAKVPYNPSSSDFFEHNIIYILSHTSGIIICITVMLMFIYVNVIDRWDGEIFLGDLE